MTNASKDDKTRQDRRIAAVMLGAVLTLFLVVLTLTLTRAKPDYVLVLVTGDDCRRQFSDTECQSIVSRAQALHARTAPRFTDLNACALVYGVGRCAALKEDTVTLRILAPGLAAIALTRNEDTILPLHYGPLSETGTSSAATGRSVYFKDRYIGRLTETSFGGAELPVLNGDDGQPLTAEALRRLGG